MKIAPLMAEYSRHENIHAVNGSWRKPVIPPLWDGRAAERIVKVLLEEL